MLKFVDNLKLHNLPYEVDPRLPQWHLAEVEFTDLWITEKQAKRFDVNHVIDIYNNFHPALMRPASTVFIDGKVVCWDGHHSAVVALLKGFDKCPCIVYETDNWDFLSTQTVEKFDHLQLIALYQTLPEDIKSQIR